MYCCLPYYIVRTPLLSLNRFDDFNFSLLEDKKYLEKLLNHIIFANPKFVKFCKERQLKESTKLTLFKYLTRMSTRTTPFANFSNISIQSYALEDDILIAEGSEIRVLYDMEWFLNLISEVEMDINVLTKLELQLNSSLYLRRKRIVLPYVVFKDSALRLKTGKKEINLNYVIEYLIEQFNIYKTIRFDELIQKFTIKFKDIPISVITDFIISTIKEGILITELRELQSFEKPLANLIKKLRSKQVNNYILIKKLESIESIIHNANSKRKLELDDYKILIRKMREIATSNRYLNIISRHPSNCRIKLGKNKKDCFNELGKVLSAFTLFDNETYEIQKYKEGFLDKFDEYAEVPLMVFLDNVDGMGNLYNSQEKFDTTEKANKIKSYLLNKVINNKDDFIDLREKELDTFLNNDNFYYSLKENLAINLIILKDKKDILFEIGPNFGSKSAFSSINRFYDILNKEEQDILNEFYSYEKLDTSDKYEIIDLKEIGAYRSALNITGTKLNYDKFININGFTKKDSDKCLSLAELKVGFNRRKNKLYIKNSNGKLVKVVNDNMLNEATLSYISRFLIEVSNGYETSPLEGLYFVENFMDFDHIPEIRYKNFILGKEKWKISKKMVNNINFKEFEKIINQWVIENKINCRLTLKELDRLILLDLNKIESRIVLYKYLKNMDKDEEYLSKSYFNNHQNCYLQSNGNNFIGEIVVPYVLDNDKLPKKVEQLNREEQELAVYSKKDLIRKNDEEWIYYEIYTAKDLIDEIISSKFNILVDKFSKDKFDFFFLRYRELDDEIRIRVKRKQKNDYIIEPIIESFCKELMSEGLASAYSKKCYFPEYNRYGGKKQISLAEEVFCIDSIFSILLLEMEYPKLHKMVYGILEIIKQFDNIHVFSISELQSLINKTEFRKNYYKERSEIKNNIEKMILPNTYIDEVVKKRNLKLKEYFTIILKNEDTLTNTPKEILLSIIHMFCNRMDSSRLIEINSLNFAIRLFIEERAKMIYATK